MPNNSKNKPTQTRKNRRKKRPKHRKESNKEKNTLALTLHGLPRDGEQQTPNTIYSYCSLCLIWINSCFRLLYYSRVFYSMPTNAECANISFPSHLSLFAFAVIIVTFLSFTIRIPWSQLNNNSIFISTAFLAFSPFFFYSRWIYFPFCPFIRFCFSTENVWKGGTRNQIESKSKRKKKRFSLLLFLGRFENSQCAASHTAQQHPTEKTGRRSNFLNRTNGDDTQRSWRDVDYTYYSCCRRRRRQ